MQRFADSPFGSHLIFGGTWAKCWHHNASLQWIMQTCQSRSWNHCMNMHELTNRETCGNCILLEVNSSNANWQGHRNLYRWWTVMSSVYQTCETSSHRPEFLSPAISPAQCQQDTTLRWRSHLLGQKFLPWFSLAFFGSQMVAEDFALLLTNMCPSTRRISPTLQRPPLPTETECDIESDLSTWQIPSGSHFHPIV